MQLRVIVTFVAIVSLWAVPAQAKTVDCNKKSLAAEIAKLQNDKGKSKSGKSGGARNPKPVTLTVAGSCNENIYINGIDDLTLIALPGAEINGQPVINAGGFFVALDIEHSNRVTVTGFTINATNGGVWCRRSSDCRLEDNLIIGDGGNIGILAALNAHTIMTGNTVSGFGTGLLVNTNASTHLLGGGKGAPNTFTGNFQGIRAVIGGDVLVDGSSGSRNVVSGNTRRGILVQNGATMWANWMEVSLNGNNPNNQFSGDIIMVGDASLRLFNTDVTFNDGHGILVTRGGDLRIGSSTVTGNARSGVALAIGSTGWVSSTITLAANGAFNLGNTDVFCDASSFLQASAGLIVASSANGVDCNGGANIVSDLNAILP